MRKVVAVLALLAFPALAADLPDLSLTPGVAVSGMAKAKICSTKWGKDARAVTQAMKRQVMTNYRMAPKDCPSGKIEIDHLISRELGGADDVKNLWPECYEKPVAGKKPSEVAEMGAHHKDRVENRLHVEVCAGRLSVEQAQKEISTDWRVPYKRYFGTP